MRLCVSILIMCVLMGIKHIIPADSFSAVLVGLVSWNIAWIWVDGSKLDIKK